MHNHLTATLTAAIMAVSAMAATPNAAKTISLAGQWQFHQGEDHTYDDTINLPGSMLTNGKGNPVTLTTPWTGSLYDSSYYFNPKMEAYRQEGNIKFPFFLTPDRHYTGYAWYKKTVQVPKDWRGKQVYLNLERAHIETTVYVNGELVGTDKSLSVPHVYDLTDYLKYGKDNDIEIRIYNGIENVNVGQDSHSVTDQTQGNWNGIIGDISLSAKDKANIKTLKIFPDIHTGDVRMDFTVNDAAKPKAKTLQINIDGKNYLSEKVTPDADGKISRTVSLGDDIRLWNEFTPSLYTVEAIYGNDTITDRFGMREIRTDGRKMMLNGDELLIRGTVGNCCFPLTGYPPTDVESWRKIFNKCKDYGLNMMRFHSYCPPEAAFIAADEVGFYLQPEGPSWPNHGVKLGVGMPIDEYLLQETERMVDCYGNHPSFCMLAAGNEPAGNWVKWVGDFVDYWHSTGDDRRIYCGASVGGGWAWDPKSDYHVKGGARGLDWDRNAPQTVDDFSAQVTQYTQKGSKPITFDINEPFLSHEQGQWCAFPDLKEIDKYTGAYKAGNFEIFRDLLRDNGMETQAEKFLHASGNLQVLAYRYEIERNLRTPNYTGFQLLGLNDYSGQGTALVGPLNVFWEEKGYVTDSMWRAFCAPVVPLAKLPKFVYVPGDTINTDIMVYNATTGSITSMPLWLNIESGDTKIYSQQITDGGTAVPIGKSEIATLSIPVDMFAADADTPHKYSLVVEGGGGDTPKVRNAYDIWVYPVKSEDIAIPDNVYVSDSIDDRAIEVLSQGGRVLLTSAGKVTMGSDVKQTYMPVFWNTSWFKMRPPHTTGAYIDTEHPLFADFPTDDWSNLNWWELLNKAQVINLGEFPAEYQPAIQPIDTWHISRKLGMIAEAKVGNGKVLVTTMDIDNDLDNRPVARQMRKALLNYVSGDSFNPKHTVDIDVIRHLYTMQAPAVDMYTKDSPDELKPKLK